MKKNSLFQKLISKQKEIASPAPNQVGFLTPFYRQVIVFFKVAPYRWLIPLALFIALMLYFLLRVKVVNLTTILQKGF